MPKAEVRKRGGSKRTVTVKPSPGTYMHCEVVPRKGPRGGHTVCGPLKHVKKKPKKALG